MAAYYNEIDRKAAATLRELITAGVIAPGEVDERSIADVAPGDLVGFSQCHFFAGGGVWSYALRLAGWADDRPVWTGSCPCQPFSVAGRQRGAADERHLWPEFRRLIGERSPAIVFGEQVASPAGRAWLHDVRADVEGMGYALGSADLCAAGVGAPHIRQRLYWVAEPSEQRREGQRLHLCERGPRSAVPEAGRGGEARRLGDSSSRGCGIVRDAARAREGGHADGADQDHRAGPVNGHWRAADWLHCRDGRWRPVEPGTFPLAHGAPARVGRLRLYGNAIVAQVAEEFIRAYLEMTAATA